jgi:hypothetical protein
MKKSVPPINENFLNLYDKDGNPTEILITLRKLYIDETHQAYNLFINISCNSIPPGLSSAGIWRLAHGIGRSKKIPKEHYNFLKKHFFSDQSKLIRKARNMLTSNAGTLNVCTETVLISDALKNRILENMRLSKKDVDFYFKKMKFVPKGLTTEKLLELLNNKETKIRKDYFDFLKRNFKGNYWSTSEDDNISNIKDSVPIVVTKRYKARIAMNIEKSGKLIDEFFLDNEKVPDGFTRDLLINWLNSDSFEINPSYKDFITRHWWKVASGGNYSVAKNAEVVILSDQYMSELNSHLKRTGIGVKKALKYADEVPKGLTYRTVDLWLKNKKSHYPKVKKIYADFVLELYKNTPDKFNE